MVYSSDKTDSSVIAANLQNICSKIKSFTENSEKEFLEIGSRLQTYLSASKNISICSSQGLCSASENKLQTGIKDLTLLLKKFSEYFSHSANEINSDKGELISIVNLVDALKEKSERFKKIVKHLRMLGISTKIESSVLGQMDNGFIALADNVDRLSGLISDKTTTIKEKAVFLISEVENTTKMLDLLECKQRRRAEVILDEMTMSLKTFEEHLNKYLEKTKRITSDSENVSRNIYEIVTSIQFHDITRQQLEHVKESLAELLDILIKKDAVSFISNDDYGMIHDVCALQEKQITNSAAEFNTAVINIHSKLQSVAENMTDIFIESNDLLKNTGVDYNGPLVIVKKELGRISEGLENNIEIENQLAESVKNVVDIVDDLSRFVLEIEEIGSEIELLALNALIKAAHTEINGSALGVLAQEIKHLSIEAKIHTNNNSDILNNIIAITKKLKVNVSNSESLKDTNYLLQTNQDIAVLIESLINTEKESCLKISRLNKDIKFLKAEIESAVSKISINKKADAFFKQVTNGLDAILSGLRNNTNIVLNKNENTLELMKNYSMQAERRIHQEYTTGSHTSSGDSFGDNVELF